MKVLGIDPGYDRLGIAIVEKTSFNEKEVLLHSECFIPDVDRKAERSIHERLQLVGLRIQQLISEYNPDTLAIENLFITKNQKTAMHVSEARGIIIYEAKNKNLAIFEYTPPQIKVAVTGDGKSDKLQVIKMIPLLIKMKNSERLDDEYDAIAVALTCLAHEYNKKQKRGA